MIRPPIVERSVDLGDVRLNVASAGSGRPVILLHGFPDSWRLWRHQIRLLAATGYRVIAPDLRGFGRSTSSRPLDVADYRMSVLVSDPDPWLAGDVVADSGFRFVLGADSGMRV